MFTINSLIAASRVKNPAAVMPKQMKPKANKPKPAAKKQPVKKPNVVVKKPVAKKVSEPKAAPSKPLFVLKPKKYSCKEKISGSS